MHKCFGILNIYVWHYIYYKCGRNNHSLYYQIKVSDVGEIQEFVWYFWGFICCLCEHFIFVMMQNKMLNNIPLFITIANR